MRALYSGNNIAKNEENFGRKWGKMWERKLEKNWGTFVRKKMGKDCEEENEERLWGRKWRR